MTIRSFQGKVPQIGARTYCDEQACVIGEVTLGEDISIWPMAVLRGDVNIITIGKGSNIQDNCTLHVSHKTKKEPEGFAITIGEHVTVGHQVMLHGCTIGDYCLIGIGVIILDGAVIQDHVLIGAGSLVPPRKILESGYLYLGCPVKKVRALTPEEMDHFEYSAKHYIALKDKYLESDAVPDDKTES